MAKTKKTTTKKIAAIKHSKQSRPNIPTAEMEELMAEEEKQPLQVEYPRNKDLDPQLLWTGKDKENQENLILEAMPIYTQEKIQPQVIIDDLRRQAAQRKQQAPGATQNLFANFNGLADEKARVEFYQHQQKWTNRLILGDSLLVMTSLAHKEGLKGKVQCIYMDPPYGIKFGSNWQTSTKSTSVSDTDETRQPEMIQAFRDTWEKGIHSYLSYLRDRLTAARDLLTESGSIFLQIGDENVHLVAMLMDEIFGAENRVATISFATTSGSSTNRISQVADYLLWYGKKKESLKYHQLYEALNRKEIIDFFNWDVHLELSNGITRKLNEKEEANPDKYIPKDARLFKRTTLDSQGASTTGRSESYTWQGKVFPCPPNRHWSVSEEGLDRMAKAGKLHAESRQNALMWKRYENEVPGRRINNLWDAQMYPSTSEKQYVVQTATKVIQRCILMTTDPGDLVLDPTCGSGVTATVAEQWGRRWITMDTSRVALTIARARLMGNQYDYYLMQDSEEGAKKESELSGKLPTKKQFANDVRYGFVYHRAPTLSPKIIAYNQEIDIIHEKWQKTLSPLQKEFNNAVNKKYQEWEIPLAEPENSKWNTAAKIAHDKWQKYRQMRQLDIDDSIAKNAQTEYLVDQPYAASTIVRVTGPFTVESLSPHRILPTDSDNAKTINPKRPNSQTQNETRFLEVIYENLKTAGIQNTRKKERLIFNELQPWANSQRIQFRGDYEENNKNKKAAICVGPEYGTVTRSFLISAARDAADMFDMLIVMGFAFEAYADESLTKIGKLPVIRARLNNDLHMANRLKSSGNNNLFVTFGEPDIQLCPRDDDMIQAQILGIDIFDPTTGEVKASDIKDIACWMIDTDYNEESFFVRHAYFTGGGKDSYKDLKRALKQEINEEEWAQLTSDKSRPFAKPASGKIAVKAINHYGDEVIKVFAVE